MNARRNFKINAKNMDDNMQKLASGMRINKAADDAAGLAVSEKMRSQIRGLQQASRNAQDGVSLIQTAEGYLDETQSLLQRMRELSVQSANGVYTAQDRLQIQTEVDALIDEVNRVASHAEFNTLKLIQGHYAMSGQQGTEAPSGLDTEGTHMPGIAFHIGANMNQFEKVGIGNMFAGALTDADAAGENGSVSGLKVDNQVAANQAISTLDEALETVSTQRATLGAFQNRLEFAIKGIDIGAQNLQAAESQIRDSDMAEEMTGFLKNQILTQSTASMLSQANMRSQLVMRVLG